MKYLCVVRIILNLGPPARSLELEDFARGICPWYVSCNGIFQTEKNNKNNNMTIKL